MKTINVFLYEWNHFWRNPFKTIAILLYVIAGVYGLHNGAHLYTTQSAEIETIIGTVEAHKQQLLDLYDRGEKNVDHRSWIDITTPYWAAWNTPVYEFKMPSPGMVFNIGQTEHYGFYKKITSISSTFDADMTQEIANPERLQIGSLDFGFTLLYLLPLLLLICLYTIKGTEAEQGFLNLIEVQNATKNGWVITRVLFYVLLLLLINILLTLYGASLTNFETSRKIIVQVLIYTGLYILFWTMIYFFIIKTGKSILNNALKMVFFWLLFTFIVPATIQQWVSTIKPANLMVDYIDIKRDEATRIHNLPKSEILKKVADIYPEILNSSLANDSVKSSLALNYSVFAVINNLTKANTEVIEMDNQEKNALVQKTYWINPVSFFQNQFNKISKTHYNDYSDYRNKIQDALDRLANLIISDMWNGVVVDKTRYLEYNESLNP